MKDTVWTCKDGREILVRDMDTSHIINCIRLIKNRNWRREYLDRLELELLIRSLK